MNVSSTNLKLQKEQEYILLNRSQLQVGKKYTYSQLSKILGIQYYTGGKGKKYQIERIKKYINWGKDTGYIVLDNDIEVGILDTIAVKDSHNTYFDSFSHVMLYNLAKYIKEHPEAQYVRLSHNYALRFSEIVSQDFIFAFTKEYRPFVASTLKLQKIQVDNYLNYVRGEGLRIFIRNCKRLEQKGVLRLNSNILIKYPAISDEEISSVLIRSDDDVNEEIADIFQEKKIREIEAEVLKDMGLNSHFHADVAGKWQIFKKEVCKRLGIKNYWRNFDIYLNVNNIYKILIEFEDVFNTSRIELKRSFANAIKESKNKQINFSNKERERINDIFIFGTDKTFISSLIYEKNQNDEAIRIIDKM